MTHRDAREVTRRVRLKRYIAFATALTCCNHLSLQAQVQDGELPASPWSSRTVRQAANPPLGPFDERKVGTTSSGNATSRPASVTLLGPIAPPKKISSELREKDLPTETPQGLIEFPDEPIEIAPPKRASNHPTATPTHTSTQKKPLEAQSERLRVPAGGMILGRSGNELSGESSNGRNVHEEPRHVRDGQTSLGIQRPVLTGPLTLEDRPTNSPTRSTPTRVASATTTDLPAGPIQLKPHHAEASADHENQLVPSESSTRRSEAKPPSLSIASSQKQGDEAMASENSMDEKRMQRIALAQRVSYELLSQPPYPAARAPEYLETPLGWGAVEQELRARLERCDALLRRNAFHSARDEAVQGLRRLSRAMDAHRRTVISAPALEKALVALREEADFHSVHQNEAVQSLVQSHSTEALKGRPLENVSPEIACQHYRTFARYQFVIAADGHAWAADLLYAYGKTLEKEAELDTVRSYMLRSQSVSCYQAAIQVAPNQSDIANQLGYTLINLDRIDEAYQALTVSLQQKPSPGAWNNMAEIYRRRGAQESAQYAVQQANALATNEPKFSYENPQVTEVDPATFAKYSPMPIQTPSIPNSTPANSQTAPGSVRPASATTSMFSKIFRR
jgi:tetratricopeptide (TPR) repeat protein